MTIWPFLPNWRRQPYLVSREYRTEIITSRSGREQRRAMRQTPRKRIEYLTGVKGDCLRDFDRQVVASQREGRTIPERVRFVTLPSGLGSGATSVTIDPVPSWIAADAALMLVNGADQSVRTVASVVGTTVNFVESEAVIWPAGTRLHPALDGYLEATIPSQLMAFAHRVWRGVVDVSVIFHVDPGSEPEEDAGSAAATLAGREVFLTRPNRWTPISLNRLQEGAQSVDYGFGRVRRFFPVEFSTRLWEGSYTGCDFDNADELRQFFARMKGKQGEFYMPTWQADLVPTAGLTSAGTTITVSGTETDSTFSSSTVFKAIAVRKLDGTWITRTVTNIAPSGGNSEITVGAAWGEDVALGSIDMVSWLPVWRFASDILTMEWPRITVAETRMSFQMLENLEVEA